MEPYLHHRIYEVLMHARHPVFISDERVDGDSLGAALALADFMAQRGIEVPIFIATPVPQQYQCLPRIHQCTTDIHVFEQAQIDVIVVFDCSDGEFVRRLLKHIPGTPFVINIDHHTTNSHYGNLNQVIDGAPATAAIIYRFFEEHHVIPSRDAATCLLTGLCFDTTVFSNSVTNEQALDTASKLILHGARIPDVIQILFRHRSIPALRVWGAALERIEQDPEQDMISTYVTQADIQAQQISEDELEGLSNFLNLVMDVDTLRVFRETHDGHVKVSLRSLTRDVSVIAKQHGGGGHRRAAGYLIERAKLVCAPDGHWRVENRQKTT